MRNIILRDIIIVAGAFSSGKTAVRETVGEVLGEKGIKTSFLSDGQYLAQLVKEGEEGRWFLRPEKGSQGFCIINQKPLELMYDRLVEDIPQPCEGQVVLIEAARCRGDSYPELDISFKSLKEKIPLSVWERSIVVYTHASWERRLFWNQDRQENPRDQLEGISFYVPRMAMETLARESDFHQGFSDWLKDSGVPVYEIQNEGLSFEALQEEARDLTRRIYQEHLGWTTKEGGLVLKKEREI